VETATRTAEVEGAPVRWLVAGSGAPLLLVHGLAGSWRWWRPVLGSLAREHELHLLDLPRSGVLARRDGDTAQWLCAWLDAAGLERASVLAHSLGGLSAARMASRRPEAVERLVLTAPVGAPLGRRLHGYAAPLAVSLVRSHPRLLPTLARDALRTGPSSLLRGALEAARSEVGVELAAVRAPTLLVWGERDALVPPSTSEGWCAALPDARLAVVPGAAHVPMWEAPDAFAGLVLDFLREPLDEKGNEAGR
jgi:pimeloyl-ACP methyl ester carboxylesterase